MKTEKGRELPNQENIGSMDEKENFKNFLILEVKTIGK